MNKILLPKLDLNITNRCNFRCSHCAFNSGLCKLPEMRLQDLERILIETKGLGGKRFDITGGEPTLRTDIEDIVKFGKSLNYNIELVTNGSLLTKERLNGLKSLGLDSIAVSLDGSNYENYNRVRKVDMLTYENVLKTIKNSIDIGLVTKVNTVVFDFNLNDITSITDWCINQKVNEHGLYYFTPVGRGNNSKETSVEPIKWLNYIREKLVQYSKAPIKISLELPLIEREFWSESLGCIGCGQRRGHLQVLPDGNVYPCAILASYNNPLTNLYQTSVDDLWNDDHLWNNYWKEISQKWRIQGGFCVDFKGVFKGNDYDSKNYGFVCPLKKFKLEEVPSP